MRVLQWLRSNLRIALWLQWVISTAAASTIGWSLGGVFCGVTSFLALSIITGPQWFVSIWFGGVGILTGLIVGLAQAFTLKCHLATKFKSYFLELWSLGSAAGFGFGVLISLYTLLSGVGRSSNIEGLLIALLSGAVLGVIQWLILKPYSNRAILWIPANVIAWVVGAYISSAVVLALLGKLSTGDGESIGAVVLWLCIIVNLTTITSSIITGVVLTFILPKFEPNIPLS